MAASVLEKALFERFLSIECSSEHKDVVQQIKDLPKGDTKAHRNVADSEEFQRLLKEYEDFLHHTIRGDLGETAAFWVIYVYLINRLYRELQRAVRTNDVELYIKVLPLLVDVFFALNRPNYARWGSYFLERLNHLDKEAMDILKAGAFSTRRTEKPYSRSAIDLTLEQTVNRDAASSATGIMHFANSESAFRRWCVTLTQRSMAVTEMKEMSGIQPGETPANQLRNWRIKRDNNDAEKLLKTFRSTCDPFAVGAPTMLVNIATAKAASPITSAYLLGTLQRGAKLRQEFHDDCAKDENRFLMKVKRVKIQNFAAENLKRKSTRAKKVLAAAEGVRDAFGFLLSKSNIDLHNVLCFPITEIPLALAHTDGTPAKTDKATLTKVLESKLPQERQENASGSKVDATIFDGGLILHEVLPRHTKSTYGKIVQDIIVKVCSAKGDSVHLLLDKYKQPSIKDVERMSRGCTCDELNTFVITGAGQLQQKKGIDLLSNSEFKEGLAEFLMREIREEYYAPIIGSKILYVSHGGKCIKVSVNTMGILIVEEPADFQGQHEEADTLIPFHTFKINGKVVIRSSDTDVVVILVALSSEMVHTSEIVMDFGSANHRRHINITSISKELEKKQAGLS